MFRQRFQVYGNPLERADPSKSYGRKMTLKDSIMETLYYIKTNWFTKKNGISILVVFVYLILLYLTYFQYPSYFESYSLATSILSVLGFLLLFLFLFTRHAFDEKAKDTLSIFGYLKHILIVFVVIGLAGWIIYSLSSDTLLSGFVGFFLNLFIVLGLLVILYLAINNIPFIRRAKERGLFKLLYNSIFLIPCYIVDGIQYLNDDLKSTPRFIFLALLIELGLIGIYWGIPKATNSFLLGDGILLMKEPKYTDIFNVVANFEDLEGSTIEPTYKYNYAISSWLFIHEQPANLRKTSNEYVSLLNYGGKPNIQYNVAKQKMRVSMDIKDNLGNIKTETIYISKTGEIPVQKWNFVVINYSNGILDVFINGELVGTSKGLVSYMEFDNITIGSDEGVSGGISNIIYYKQPIAKTQISLHYNTFKDKYNPYI